MFNSEYNFHIIKSRCKEHFFASTLILLLLIPSLKISAHSLNELTRDSLRKKYALSDPRNPDCPCHKYQKKAEKEFNKLSRTENIHSRITYIEGKQIKSLKKVLHHSTSIKIREFRGYIKHKKVTHYVKQKTQKRFGFFHTSINACPNW